MPAPAGDHLQTGYPRSQNQRGFRLPDLRSSGGPVPFYARRLSLPATSAVPPPPKAAASIITMTAQIRAARAQFCLEELVLPLKAQASSKIKPTRKSVKTSRRWKPPSLPPWRSAGCQGAAGRAHRRRVRNHLPTSFAIHNVSPSCCRRVCHIASKCGINGGML